MKAILKSTALPDSVCYLHSLTTQGLADSYNYYDNAFVVRINMTDRQRYPVLQGVECVMLKYRRKE